MPRPDFEGCRTRLKWVDHAVNALDEEFRVWMLEHNMHATTVEYQSEADVHVFRLTPDSLPGWYGVIAGNIVHQLRATLDNIVWQLVIANGQEPRGGGMGNAFPLLHALRNEKPFVEQVVNSLRGVHPDHVALIEGMQPYRHPEYGPPALHPLAYLANLSNVDKHQVLKVVRVEEVAQIDVAFLGDSGQTVLDSWHVQPSERHPGAIVGWAQFSPGGFHHDVHMNYSGWGRLAFDDGIPVIPRLREIAAVVWFAVLGVVAPLGQGRPVGPPVDITPATVRAMREGNLRRFDPLNLSF